MITQSSIYWLTRLDALCAVLDCNGTWAFLAFVMTLLAVVFGLVGNFAGNGAYELLSEFSDEDLSAARESLRKWCKRCVAGAVLCLAMCSLQAVARAFVPTSREMAAIIVVPKIANSESVQAVGTELVDLAKEWLAELHPAKNVSQDKSSK